MSDNWQKFNRWLKSDESFYYGFMSMALFTVGCVFIIVFTSPQPNFYKDNTVVIDKIKSTNANNVYFTFMIQNTVTGDIGKVSVSPNVYYNTEVGDKLTQKPADR